MKVALIGRPNVGKSTLFNRLTETRDAIETTIPGTTRDRHRGVFRWGNANIELIDTPGLKTQNSKLKTQNLEHISELEYKIQLQAKSALKEADVILYIIDFQTGPLGEDYEILKGLRKEKIKPTFLVVNKADKVSDLNEASQYIKLGLGSPIPVSALNGAGIAHLLKILAETSSSKRKEPAPPEKTPASHIQIAIVGKPNVGKSSLFNALLKEERVVVSPIPHTTRNPNNTELFYGDCRFTIIDTAGLRKKSRVYDSDTVEIFSVKKTLEKLQTADVVFFMVDAPDGISVQDLKISQLIKKNRAGIITIVNKWDAIPEKTTKTLTDYRQSLYAMLRSLDFVPMIFTDVGDPYNGKVFGVEEKFLPTVNSASDQPLYRLLDLAISVYQNCSAIIPQEELTSIMRQAIGKHAPPRDRGKPAPFIRALEQVGTNPPLFQVTLKGRATIPPHYLGYLKNQLRLRYPFWGTPIEFELIVNS